ncbi:Nin one binding Zn-ribbon like-domain-containing protein [Syncephalis plumigaleata]|nr:Nin one binding Zn-ribbon like-domain-containing protein [Syncephalis plumigaleata]
MAPTTSTTTTSTATTSTATVTAATTLRNSECLVLDTAPLLNGHNLQRLATKLYAIPEVIAEVRDKKSRAILDQIDLTIRSPTEEAMHAIIRFAKLTGDFAVLSMTDIKVMALAYTLEKERNGIAHLKTMPTTRTATANTQRPIVYVSGRRLEQPFHTEEKKQQQSKVENDSSVDKMENKEVNTSQLEASMTKLDINEATSSSSSSNTVKQVESTSLSEESTEETIEPTTPKQSSSSQNKMMSAVESNNNNKEEKDEDEEESEEDDGEWITPDNLDKHLQRDQGLNTSSNQIKRKVDVACMTADFAMQNVLIQMGLHLMSMDGMVIQRVKTWVLRCHSCYKITTNMEKHFCPSCGNNTLMRVSAGLNKQGELCIYLKENFQYNTRGTRYNIPKPQGGKHNNDLLLCEDERVYQVAVHRNRRKAAQQNFFDPDYIPAMLQGNSGRSSQNSMMPTIGHGRRNPNASRRGGKSKNKRH